MNKLLRDKGLVRKITLCLTVAYLASCTTVPVVNGEWISSNCRSLPIFDPERTNVPNCSLTGSNWSYTCSLGNGEYRGKFFNNKKHGYGVYEWSDGSKYEGIWREDKKWCGIETQGNTFYTHINGSATKNEAGVDWGTVGAVVLVAGAVALAAEGGGGGGGNDYSSNDYQSKCKYMVNGTEISRDSSYGSCPQIVYQEPLMCSSYSSIPFTRQCNEKACGNSCISTWKTCHIGKGTACNNYYQSYP